MTRAPAIRVAWLAALAGACAACASPATVPDAKDAVSLETSLACDATRGYVLRFDITNIGETRARIPDDLLPWSPALLASDFEVVGDSGQRLSMAGVVGAHSWDVTMLEPGGHASGTLALHEVFVGRSLDALLAKEDATLHWRYANASFDRAFDGSLRLPGASHGDACERESPPDPPAPSRPSPPAARDR